MKFKFTKEILEVAKLQVTQIKDFSKRDYYNELCVSEFSQIREHLNNPKTILELGCGLGRMSVYLNHYFKDDSIKYILADYDVLNKKPKYMWNPKKQYYNKLHLTKKFCLINNLKNFKILNLGKESINKLKDVSIVMSFLSVGFHIPIEDYIKNIMKIINNDSVLFFGIRKSKYNQKSFKKYFNNRIIKTQESIYTREQILILTNKRD